MPDVAARAAALRGRADEEGLSPSLTGGFDDAWGLQQYLDACWAYPILYPPFESARTRVEDAACALLEILQRLWERAGFATRWTSMQAATANAQDDDVADQLILWAANERFVAADRDWTAIEAEIRPGATYVQCPALDLHRMLYQPPRVRAGEGGTGGGMAPVPAYLWGAALMQHPWSGGTGVRGAGHQDQEVMSRLLDAIAQDRAERHLGPAPVMGAETARRIFRILSWPAWGWAENLQALITLFRKYPLAGDLWDELTVALVSSPAEDLQAYGIALTEALDREAPRAAAQLLTEGERLAPLPDMMALGRSLRDQMHPCVSR